MNSIAFFLRNSKTFLQTLWILTLLLGCNSTKESTADSTEQLYVASDLVYVGDFTSGLEGPAVDSDGTVYFVNPKHNGSIGKIDSKGAFSIYIDNLPDGSTANGIRFGSKGNMFLADYTGHNVLTINPASKEVNIYAHNDQLNQPNDLAIMSRDILFASDPNWADSTGQLWRVDPNIGFVLLEDDMGTTNGIEVSPDEKRLYVNESIQRTIWAYDLSIRGEISNKKLLFSFPDYGLDGMRCDSKGNLYVTRHGKGTVAKISPEGTLLQEIELKGKLPSNIAFGGVDGRTAFVTLQDRGYIETFRVEHPGRNFTR